MSIERWVKGQPVWYFPSGNALRTGDGSRKRPALFIAKAGKRALIQLLTEEGPGVTKYVLPENLEIRKEVLSDEGLDIEN